MEKLEYKHIKRIYISPEQYEKYFSNDFLSSYGRYADYVILSNRGTKWFIVDCFDTNFFQIDRVSNWGIRRRLVIIEKCRTGVQKRNMYTIKHWDDAK